MSDFFRSVRFKILLAVFTVMLGFMIAAVYTGGTASIFSQIISTVTQPVQRLSANMTDSATEFFNKYLRAAQTYEENALLREQINEYRRQLVDYEKIRHEYEQLQKISDMREQRSDLTITTAAVIGRDATNNPFYAFTIDKGSLDEVKQYDPVMTDAGLVGYVTEVGLVSSKVMTLLDVNMNVAISNSATRDIGNLSGRVELAEDGLCVMEYLPRDSETAAGDLIITGGGSIFPKDLIIGEVVSVSTSSRGNSLEAVIKPAADIIDVKNVFIITHFEGQGAD